MVNYVVRTHDVTSPDIQVGVRDAQFAPGVNTSFMARLTALDGDPEDADNLVRFFIRFKIEGAPEQLIDKYTFYSDHNIVITDTERLFVTNALRAFEIWAQIYMSAFNRANELFVQKLGSPEGLDPMKLEPGEALNKQADDILSIYFHQRENGML
jgi:hypothetical protein